VAVCIIWGTTYFGIRVSLESMPPGLMGGLRWTIAGGLLAAWVAARGGTFPPRSRWGSILLLGFLLLVLGNGGVVVAEQWVSERPGRRHGRLVAVLDGRRRGLHRDGERLTRNAVIGLVIGFSGIVILVWPDLTTAGGDRRFVLGIVALQIAALGWSLGSAYSKRHGRTDDVLATTACQMLAGGLMMVAAGTVRGEWADLFFTHARRRSLIYLSTLGAIGGFVAYTYALRHLPISFVSLYAYINPIIAVALGVALLGEPFDSRMATAAALVFAGVAFVRWAPVRRAGARRSATGRNGPEDRLSLAVTHLSPGRYNIVPVNRLPRIVEIGDGSEGWGFFLCVRKDVRPTRAGAPLVSLASRMRRARSRPRSSTRPTGGVTTSRRGSS
jgi:drug/metabolite transporter (DMT)-like permease